MTCRSTSASSGRRLRGRKSQIEHLAQQVEIAFDIGRIDNDDNRIGTSNAGLHTAENVDRYRFICRSCRKGIGARQIDDVNRFGRVEERANLLLDSDPRVIPDAG